jgi:hypothetical protein
MKGNTDIVPTDQQDETDEQDDAETVATAEQLREVWLRNLRDPAVRLDMLGDPWGKTRNPLFVWEAIGICLKQKLDLSDWPAWVTGYLETCVDRMASGAHDFRKALPEIMGFAGQRGPRAVYNDEHAARARLALPIDDAALDDLTLLRWLAEDFGLPAPPRSLEGWRKAIVSSDVRVPSKP